MKRILLAFLLLSLAVLPLQAAGSSPYEKGYSGNVGLSFCPGVSKGHGYEVGFETAHGYSFGNGAWLGGGVGVLLDAGSETHVIPLFFEVKYHFIDGDLSPFLSLRGGYRYWELGSSAFVSPAVGLSMGSFSAGFAYQAFSGADYFDNLLNFTVSWNF